MTPRHSLSLSLRLLPVTQAPLWNLGWLFAGIGSFFLYNIHLMEIFPLSFRSILKLGDLVPLLFIVIGLAFAGQALREGIRALRLLEKGALAPGVLAHIDDTGAHIGNEPLWWAHYHFTAENGQHYLCLSKMGQPSADVSANAKHLLPTQRETAEDGSSQLGKFESLCAAFAIRKGRVALPGEATLAYPQSKTPVTASILYDPTAPEDALALTSIPGEFTRTPEGTFSSSKQALPGLIIPLLVLGGHLIVQLVLQVGVFRGMA